MGACAAPMVLGGTRSRLAYGGSRRTVDLRLTRTRPRLVYPVRASPSPQSVRVAARSSRAGSGTTSCCGHDGSPLTVSLPAKWGILRASIEIDPYADLGPLVRSQLDAQKRGYGRVSGTD